jgi:hypothetical protein
MSRPLKRHRTPRGCEVPEYLKPNLIVAAPKIWCNIERIIIPDQQAAPRWPCGDAEPIDVELVSGVCREVQQCTSRRAGKVELAAESDNSSSCVALGGIYPVRGPNPVCLELVDGLHVVVNSIWVQRWTGGVHSYFLLLVCHHCD